MRLLSSSSAYRGAADPGGEALPEEVLELTAALAREEPAVVVARQPEEVSDTVIRGVVEVRGACDRLGVVREAHGEAEQVVAVVTDLQRGVRDRPLAVLLDPDQHVAVLEPVGVTPLLELDDEVGRAARDRVLASQDDVGPLAREGKLVLEEHLDVVEAGGDQVRAQSRQAPLP